MPVQPLHVGGHWQIVNVGWGGGVFVYVTTTAYYDQGTAASRTAELALTKDGEDAGGRIIGQKTFHVPVSGSERAKSVFCAVLRFSRAPKGTRAAFSLKLNGSITVTDTSNPSTTELFCGTTTFTAHYSRYLTHFGGPEQTQVWETVTWTLSTPAGTSTISWSYQLADVTADDVNRPPPDQTGSSTSIWYIDAFGNYVDTHRPCDELPPPGTPVTSTHTEGFDHIEVDVYPRRGYQVLPVSQWIDTQIADDVIVPKNNQAIGGFQWQTFVPRPQIGLNSDHLPIYDDIADGQYDFRLAKLQFSGLPPPRPGQQFSVLGVYPLTTVKIKYSFLVATTKPYRVHRTIPNDLLIAAGVAPSTDQAFD
jgi:hypothetical protein